LLAVGALGNACEDAGHRRDAEVVDVAVDRPGEALGLLDRGVAEEHGTFGGLAADSGVGRRDARVAQRGLVGGGDVEVRDALRQRIRERDVRARPDHAVGKTW